MVVSAGEKFTQSKGGWVGPEWGRKGTVLKTADRGDPSEKVTFQQRLEKVEGGSQVS